MVSPFCRWHVQELEDLQIIEPTAKHTATVIFVHGLGQSNRIWSSVVEDVWAANLPHVRWILPQALHNPVSLNDGECRPSWFDVHQLPPGPSEFEIASPSLEKSISSLEDLILSEVHSGLDSNRIVLMGFSQGASIALMTALSSLHELGGLASLSGWIPLPFRQTNTPSHFPNLQLFWCHGDEDEEIPLDMGMEAVDYLESLGIQVEKKIYERLSHSTNSEELSDIGEWIGRVLPS
ncbi:Phospholipase/carboxylesterase/thioesterase [Flagelloscypha sp. PMI_526]|nr:Phospholipase/carboxylesterase/thioesterase [Flagelloscypha sp. PMI_526]